MGKRIGIEAANQLLHGKKILMINEGDEMCYKTVSWNGFGIFFTDGSYLTVAHSSKGDLRLTYYES